MNSEIIKVRDTKILCRGFYINQLGHPKVYIRINKLTNIAVCPYCSSKYVYEFNSMDSLCLK